MKGTDLTSLLRQSLQGFRTSSVGWARAQLRLQATWVAGTPRPPDRDGVYSVGRCGDRQWAGYGTPEVVPQMLSVGELAYVRDSWALDAFEQPPGLDRLDRVVGDRWVRTTASKLARENRTPEADLDLWMHQFTDESVRQAELIHTLDDGRFLIRCGRVEWTIDPASLTCTTPRLDELLDFQLSYDIPEAGSSPSEPEDALDALALEGPLGLRRVPRKPSASSADVLPPDGDATTWTVSHPALDELLHVRSCYDAERLVIDDLRHTNRSLLGRLDFDSEGSLFAAYCEGRKDALALRKHLDRLIAEAKDGAG